MTAIVRSSRQQPPFSLDLRTACTLTFRAISHRMRQLLGLAPRPRALTVTITRRCNSRCVMCNIWRLRPGREELPLEVITRFLSSPRLAELVELDLTGGEPFLRKDLPQLVRGVARLHNRTLPRLKTVALATNGLLPSLVARVVKEMLAAIQGKFDLAVVCSLDGLGERHDQVRGVQGAYQQVRTTIERLQEIKKEQTRFWLGIKTTILPLNWDQLPGLIRFSQDQGLFHILSPVLFTPERFRNVTLQDELDVLATRRQALIDLYSQESLHNFYYSHVVVDTLTRGSRRISCTAAGDHFFIEGDGTVFPCPLVNLPLGHIKAQTMTDILASPRRREIARKVGRLPSCPRCLEPGCIRFSLAGDGLAFLKFLVGRGGGGRFQKAFVDEGLEKYFSRS